MQVLSPPERCEVLPDEAPVLSKDALCPWTPWFLSHQAVKLAAPARADDFAALYSGRISPEPYQFAPVNKLLQLPQPRLLIADDVGLGKTIEAGICLLELIARGRGKRILLIVPPGLISQWQEEMLEKFGLYFTSIENASSLERAQTSLAEGIKPWVFLNRIITSTEYIKKKDVIQNALGPRWDAIVVDEAHYLAESGTPKNPYTTARARLGQQLRSACNSLILLTATPHNGYGHSFRSLIEIVEPTDATFQGEKEIIRRRVARSMIRRLKPQVYKTKDGKKIPAFMPREPVAQIPVTNLSPDEKEIFRKVSSYCAKTAAAAADTDDSELISFAMQIIKKRMLSSRKALAQTVEHRLSALASKKIEEEPPSRSEIRELQGDLPLGEATHERIAQRLVKSSVPKEAKLRAKEKKQLTEIQKLLEKVQEIPDPKIQALLADLKRDVVPAPGEKAIIFTEYRDTLGAIREALDADPDLKGHYVELTGGLSSKKRKARMAEFTKPDIRLMIATDAASEGLNLQFHCRRLYHCELPWNPNRMEQRNGRIDRHGQMRNPIIRYLFYPDSPEDDLLNRLIARIVEIQNDRVSTPDILGFLSSARIEEALTRLDAEDKKADASRTLFKVIEEQRALFVKEVAPLLAHEELSYGGKVDPNSLSADPMVGDDLEFESLVLAWLGKAVQKGDIEHTYSVVTPRDLKGAGVLDRYPCVTMRRSVAAQYPSSEVEFVTRLHPLFLAMVDNALRHLTAQHSPSTPSRRVAARTHPAAREPYAVFTFCTTQARSPSGVFSIALDPAGNVLQDGQGPLAMDGRSSVGDPAWGAISKAFTGSFSAIQKKAQEAAVERLKTDERQQEERRKKIALVLREDAERYRVDRQAEIEKEEKEASLKEAENRQLLLDIKSVSGFKARRAAVDTFHRRRVEEIAQYEAVREPPLPQPLGVLFVFPPEDGHAS